MADNAIFGQLEAGCGLQESIRTEYKAARREGSFAHRRDELINEWRTRTARWLEATENILAKSSVPLVLPRFKNARGSAQVADGENAKWSALDNLLRAKLAILYEIHKASVAQTEKTIVFNIQHSVVGSVNLAPVLGSLEVSVSALQRGGQDDLARVIKDLVEKIPQSTELTPDERRNALELTNSLSEEMNKEPNRRAKATISAILSGLDALLARASQLAALWQIIQGFLR
jgi:hypothetical protein